MNVVGCVVHLTIPYTAFDGTKATQVSGVNSVALLIPQKLFFPNGKRKDIITSVIYL